MNYLNLFHVCKILICMLYSIATAFLVSDTMMTYKRDADQLFRRRMLALSFGVLSMLYFSHLVILGLFPHFLGEENYVGGFLLLFLFVFPALLYLLRMVSGDNFSMSKKRYGVIMALPVFIILCHIIGTVIDRQWISTIMARCIGGTIWAAQIYLQGWIIYKIECLIKGSDQFDRYIRTYAYLFISIGIIAFPILFLYPGSVYWQFLQVMMWISHGCLFFYILRRDRLIVTLPAQFKPVGLLYETSPIYQVVVDDSSYVDLYEKLLYYFNTEKPYLQSGINVADVANHLSSNKTYLSRLLNEKLSQNFNQFVNAFRVKEAQRLVTEEGPVGLKELCKRAGFTSMASFTVAFKLNTGMTPGEWCKKQKRLH